MPRTLVIMVLLIGAGACARQGDVGNGATAGNGSTASNNLAAANGMAPAANTSEAVPPANAPTSANASAPAAAESNAGSAQTNVASRAAGASRAKSESGSCGGELGLGASEALVGACYDVSPSARACNIGNSCATIRAEIARACRRLGANPPEACQMAH